MTTAAPTTAAEDVAQLLAECSPACLLAAAGTACRCRCSGTHHGEMLARLVVQEAG